MEEILKVNRLKVWDERNREVLVDGVSFLLKRGECLAIVGESGSGKSMTCRSIMGLNKPWIRQDGEILLEGEDLLKKSRKELRSICGRKLCMIMQNGMSAFDPSCVVGVHFRETLKEKLGYEKKRADHAMIEAMKKVMLKDPEGILKKYPFQLSGGMLQRCMIALAIVLQPDIIIADEPTTALDLITQYEVIQQFQLLRRQLRCSMIFVSHDLGIVKQISDYVLVMKDGHFVEHGTLEEIFESPKEEYTKQLIGTKREMGREFKRIMEATHD